MAAGVDWTRCLVASPGPRTRLVNLPDQGLPPPTGTSTSISTRR